MKYLEDDFELDAFKRSFRQSAAVPVKKKNIFIRAIITLAEMVLAFAAAYILYKGGQYLIDIIKGIPHNSFFGK